MTETKFKFTTEALKALKPLDATKSYGDSECPGLRIRITPNGCKTFTFNARSKATGELINKTLGRFPTVTLAQAHEWAHTAIGQVARREDLKVILPKGDEKTVRAALDDYDTTHMSSRKTGREIMVCLRSLAERSGWMPRSLKSLTREELRSALLKTVKRGKNAMASREQTLMSSFLFWAQDAGYCDANPIAGMKLVGGAGRVGDHVLEDDEIRTVWHALNNPVEYDFDPVYARALLIALTTGVRAGLPSRMKCASVVTDDRKHGWYWRLGRDEMKMDRKFVLPLNRLTRDILSKVDLKGQTFVCPTTSGDFRDKAKNMRHRSLSRQLQALIKRLGMDSWTPRDLRRTVTTLLRRHPKPDGTRYSREDIRPFLSHQTEQEARERKQVKGTVMDHYDHWDAYEEKQAIADHLASIITRIVSEGREVRLAA